MIVNVVSSNSIKQLVSSNFFTICSTNTKCCWKKNIILMCEKTWNTIGKKHLLGRINVVLSPNIIKGVLTYNSIDDVIDLAYILKVDMIWVIGENSIIDKGIENKYFNNLYIINYGKILKKKELLKIPENLILKETNIKVENNDNIINYCIYEKKIEKCIITSFNI